MSLPRLLITLGLASALLPTFWSFARAQSPILGDCNCNGTLDAGDPICAVLRLIGSFPETCTSVCGNAVLEPGEECELNDPPCGERSCASHGLGSGTLACGSGCVFDTSGCVTTTTTLPAACPLGPPTCSVVNNPTPECESCINTQVCYVMGAACCDVFNDPECTCTDDAACGARLNTCGCAAACCATVTTTTTTTTTLPGACPLGPPTCSRVNTPTPACQDCITNTGGCYEFNGDCCDVFDGVSECTCTNDAACATRLNSCGCDSVCCATTTTTTTTTLPGACALGPPTCSLVNSPTPECESCINTQVCYVIGADCCDVLNNLECTCTDDAACGARLNSCGCDSVCCP